MENGVQSIYVTIRVIDDANGNPGNYNSLKSEIIPEEPDVIRARYVGNGLYNSIK